MRTGGTGSYAKFSVFFKTENPLLGSEATRRAMGHKAVVLMSVVGRLLLQKSKVASVRIFGETLKREAIDDSDNLSRVTEVAYEFSVRR